MEDASGEVLTIVMDRGHSMSCSPERNVKEGAVPTLDVGCASFGHAQSLPHVAKERRGRLRIIIRAFFHLKTMNMERMEHEFLNELGFRYVHTPVAVKAASATAATGKPMTLVHCCCEAGSLMSRPYTKYPMDFVDITKEDDFTTEKGYQKSIASIKGPEDTFFY